MKKKNQMCRKFFHNLKFPAKILISSLLFKNFRTSPPNEPTSDSGSESGSSESTSEDEMAEEEPEREPEPEPEAEQERKTEIWNLNNYQQKTPSVHFPNQIPKLKDQSNDEEEDMDQEHVDEQAPQNPSSVPEEPHNKSPVYMNENTNSSANDQDQDHKSDFSHEPDPPDHSSPPQSPLPAPKIEKSPSKSPKSSKSSSHSTSTEKDPDIEKLLKETKIVLPEIVEPIISPDNTQRPKKQNRKRRTKVEKPAVDMDTSDEETSDRSRSKSIDKDAKSKRGRPPKKSEKSMKPPTTWPSNAHQKVPPQAITSYDTNSDSNSATKKKQTPKKKRHSVSSSKNRSTSSEDSSGDSSDVEKKQAKKSATKSITKTPKLKLDSSLSSLNTSGSKKSSSSARKKPPKSKPPKPVNESPVPSESEEDRPSFLPRTTSQTRVNIPPSSGSSSPRSDSDSEISGAENNKNKKIEKAKSDKNKSSAFNRIFVPNGKGKGGKGGAKGGQVVIITPDEVQIPKSSDSMNSSSGSPQHSSLGASVVPAVPENLHFGKNLSPSSAYSVNSNHPPSPIKQVVAPPPQKSPLKVDSLIVSIQLSKIDLSRLPRGKGKDRQRNSGYFEEIKREEHQENGKLNIFNTNERLNNGGLEQASVTTTATIKKEYNPIFDSPPRSLDAKFSTPAKLKREYNNAYVSPKDDKFSPEQPDNQVRRKRSNSSSSNHKEKKRRRLYEQQQQNEQMLPTNHDRLAGGQSGQATVAGNQEEAASSRQDVTFQKPIYISYFERNTADLDDLEIR